MFVKSISLTNFRNMKGEHSFEFKKGCNLFYGGNFAGKSTVHKAIALCLNINDSDNKNLEEYVNDLSDYFEITLQFSHGGKEFKEVVYYNRNTKESKRELFVDSFSSPSFNTASSVKDELAKIIDPFLGEHALFMMQDSLSIINAKDSERLELFKKIRSINFKKQADELDAQIKKIKDEDLKGIEINLIALTEKEYEPIELKPEVLSKEELLSKKDKLSEIEKSLIEVKNEKEKLESLFSNRSEVKLTVQGLESEIISIEENIRNKKSSIDSNRTSTREEINQIEETVNNLKEELQKPFDDSILQKEKENSLSALRTSLESKQKEHDSIILERKRWRVFDTEIEEKQNQKNELQVSFDIIKNTLSSCKEGICPTCKKPFDSKDLSNHEEELKIVSEKLNNLSEEIITLKEERSKQEEEKKKLEELSNKKKNLFSEIGSLKEKIDYTEKSFEDKIQSAKESFESSKKAKKELIQEKESNKESKVASLEKTIKSIEEDIKSFELTLVEKRVSLKEVKNKEQILSKQIEDFVIADTEELENTKKTIISDIESQQEVDQFNKIAELKNKELEETKERDAKKKFELNKEKNKLLQEIEHKNTAKKILLKEFPNFIIQQTIQDVEDKMNSFVEQIHDKGLNLKLHGTATSLKFLCGENKDKLRDVRSTSGAEKFLIALGFTNIFNTELDLQCLFLDEADQAMNEENTKKLYSIIESLPFEQLFIITHNKVLQSVLIEDGANSFKFVDGKVEV